MCMTSFSGASQINGGNRMDLRKKVFCVLLAAVMCVSVSSCSDKKAVGKAQDTSSSAADVKPGKSDKPVGNVPDEPDIEALGQGIGDDADKIDHTEELEQISAQTDAFLMAVQQGDISGICDMLEPTSKYYSFFDKHRDSTQLSKILQNDFGDMVWTHWADTDLSNSNWLENTYAEHGEYTRSYVCAGVKEMLFFDEYFLLNFSKGQSVSAEFKIQKEDDCYTWLKNTLDKMPLLRNNWSIKCTLPDADGNVKFNIDDDYIFDYTSLLTLDGVAEDKMAQTYITTLAETRGTIEDENATMDQSPELREMVAQRIREKRFEEAWQLLAGLDEDGYFADRTTYSDLDEAGKARVDDYISEHTYSVVCDHSTQVYDASRRRHIFTQIYYDAIAGDDELEIESWLADNHVMESGEAVYFDITEDGRLATALSGYLDIIAKLG